MVTKIHKDPAPEAEKEPLSASVKDSAQQIWQAGLGAFTRAQAEGSKAFEALVKEGVNMQRKSQAAAEERIADATQKMTSMASEISNKASGQWDKLENIFEDRVAKALNKLGVPSAKDVNALIARIDELNHTVQQMAGKLPASQTKASAPKKAAPLRPAPVASTTVKPTAKRAAKAAIKTTTKPVARPAPKAAAKTKSPTAAK